MTSSVGTNVDSPFLLYLRQLHADLAKVHEGSVATYIPELAHANPDWFGICVVTAAGNLFEVGDTRQPFTIQSISKPFVYGMALEDNTRVEVLEKVGVEPTGDAFNAISLEERTGRPRNPMINAGAIATAGMIAGMTPEIRQQRILQSLSLFAGRELHIDESVYRSESETGHRNRAIGHMLRNFGILTVPPDPVVELYFKQCSVAVTCRDLAVMAATLSNRGMNPLTGRQAIRGEYVESVLSVMASSGMYDYAGEWLYRIGMPAKSGVSGGIVAVLPGQLGIGVYSPPLDGQGNSVRGIKVCDALSRSMNLHLFNLPVAGRSVIRLQFSGSRVNSTRLRTQDEARALRESGEAIQIYQLQGDLVFSTCLVVVQKVLNSLETIQSLILDLRHVPFVDESACRQLHDLRAQLAPLGKHLLFSRMSHLGTLRRYMRFRLKDRFDAEHRSFEDNDMALEWCENHWLEIHFQQHRQPASVPTETYELFRGLNPEELSAMAGLLELRCYRGGEVMMQIGSDAQEVFILHSGQASVTIPLADGRQRRLALYSPGMSFGEVAMLDGATRSAVVIAESDVECHVLTKDKFDSLTADHPRIKIKLLENMALGIAGHLRKVTRELSVFDY